jgi:hypothetical protein
MPGAPLMQIINLDQLYINADVSESFLAVLEPNDEVTLRFPAYPDFEQRTKNTPDRPCDKPRKPHFPPAIAHQQQPGSLQTQYGGKYQFQVFLNR